MVGVWLLVSLTVSSLIIVDFPAPFMPMQAARVESETRTVTFSSWARGASGSEKRKGKGLSLCSVAYKRNGPQKGKTGHTGEVLCISISTRLYIYLSRGFAGSESGEARTGQGGIGPVG